MVLTYSCDALTEARQRNSFGGPLNMLMSQVCLGLAPRPFVTTF